MNRYSKVHTFIKDKSTIYVLTPKYRLKVLKGNLGKDLYRSIYIYSNMKKFKVVEPNVQVDHVHLVM